MAKNYKLAQLADKDRVYGSLKEFTRNPKFWRSSDVGREYCYMTEEGRAVIVDMMEDVLRTIDVLDRQATDQRAKEMVIETLKDSK